jgi:hypothetical protein
MDIKRGVLRMRMKNSFARVLGPRLTDKSGKHSRSINTGTAKNYEHSQLRNILLGKDGKRLMKSGGLREDFSPRDIDALGWYNPEVLYHHR